MGIVYDDIARIGRSEVDAPEAVIGSDFFLRNFDIPDVQPVEKQPPASTDPLENWQDEVNRALMSGSTADEILHAMGEPLSRSRRRGEIESYVRKYEGLIGTVFLDSGAIKRGFPMSLIPRRYRSFNSFAVNCPCSHNVVKRGVRGGVGGDIESFLNNADGVVEETEEICDLTGLPVLREGVFTREVISSLLKRLGCEGDTVRELREAMLKCVVRQAGEAQTRQETQTPDMSFGLRSPDISVTGQSTAVPADVEMGRSLLSDSRMNDLMRATETTAPVAADTASLGCRLRRSEVILDEQPGDVPTEFEMGKVPPLTAGAN